MSRPRAAGARKNPLLPAITPLRFGASANPPRPAAARSGDGGVAVSTPAAVVSRYDLPCRSRSRRPARAAC